MTQVTEHDSPPNIVRLLGRGSLEVQDLAGNRVALFNGRTGKLELTAGPLVGGAELLATAAELNVLDKASGIIAANGLGMLGVARATFDATGDETMRTIGPHGLGVTIPDTAAVVGGFHIVREAFTSDETDAGTIALHAQEAGDLVVAAAVSGAPYSTTGIKALVPKANTPETTGILLTGARELVATVAEEALLTGKLDLFVYYVL